MPRIPPIRTEAVKDASALSIRLNDIVDIINDIPPRFVVRKVANVQAGVRVSLPFPGFTVGAVVFGGCKATSGGGVPASTPWIDWTQQGDGSVSFFVSNLPAFPALFVVYVVLFEATVT